MTGLNLTPHLRSPPLISTLLQQGVTHPNTKSQPFSTVSPPHLQSTPSKFEICDSRLPKCAPTRSGAPVYDRLKPHPTSSVEFNLQNLAFLKGPPAEPRSRRDH